MTVARTVARRRIEIDFLLDTRKKDAWSVVEVRGELDAHTAPRLREGLSELVDQGVYRVVIDAEGLEFMDSTGLGVLVGALKRVREHDGTLVLVCTRPNLLRLLAVTGLDKVVPVFPTLDEATAS